MSGVSSHDSPKMKSAHPVVRRAMLGGLLAIVAVTFGSTEMLGVCLHGNVIDSADGTPLPWATIRVMELGRSERSHDRGEYSLCGLPTGRYTIVVEYIGYQTLTTEIDLVAAADSVRIDFILHEADLASDAVVVSGTRVTASIAERSRTVSGADLMESMGTTVAGMVEDLPGVASQGMTAATARPVLRGLGGDRLVMLENGRNASDASAFSGDHAVTIDPLVSERITIVRGPFSLLHSSNAIGGVIDVETGSRLDASGDEIHGVISVVGMTGAPGGGLAGSIDVPLTTGLTLGVEGSAKMNGDGSTPLGRLGNSDVTTLDADGNLHYSASTVSGNLGARAYASEYGIPGDSIVGHTEGVRIEMNRSELYGSAHYTTPSSLLDDIGLSASHNRYHHREIESDGAIGTEYGILTTSAELRISHDPTAEGIPDGSVALGYAREDFDASGLSLPRSLTQRIHGVIAERFDWRSLSLSLAIRADHQSIEPFDRGNRRAFSGLSAGAGATYRFTPEIAIGADIMRSYRPPTAIELYSEGPHLASYSYEIGNDSLAAEHGWGGEFTFDARHRSVTGSGSLFAYLIDGYIAPRPTGDTDRASAAPIYRMSSESAFIRGAELSVGVELFEDLRIKGNASYVRGDRTGTDSMPLNSIVPFSWTIQVEKPLGSFVVGASANGRARQERVGAFERPTDGYALLNAHILFRSSTSLGLHAVVLRVDNVTNAVYRNHLSRLKESFPEPGRSISIFYRLLF